VLQWKNGDLDYLTEQNVFGAEDSGIIVSEIHWHFL